MKLKYKATQVSCEDRSTCVWDEPFSLDLCRLASKWYFAFHPSILAGSSFIVRKRVSAATTTTIIVAVSEDTQFANHVVRVGIWTDQSIRHGANAIDKRAQYHTLCLPDEIGPARWYHSQKVTGPVSSPSGSSARGCTV